MPYKAIMQLLAETLTASLRLIILSQAVDDCKTTRYSIRLRIEY